MSPLTPRIGEILSVQISPGGIPKLPVESATVGPDGLAGDVHAHSTHTKPSRAVLLMDEELIHKLVGEGFPLHAGALGENLTVRGLAAQTLPPGTRLRCLPDGPLLETTESREPCSVLNKIDSRLKHFVRDRSGMFTRVLEPGRVFPGQRITIAAAPLRAGVLIGGQSTRMGVAKHNLPLATGMTVLEHVCDVVRPLAMNLQLLGNATDLPPSLQKMTQRADARAGAGPLAGLVSLLNSVEEKCGPGGGWGLLLACDMPKLERGPLARLWNAIENGLTDEFDAAAFLSDNPRRLHATCAFYHPRVLPQALKQLDAERSLQRLLASVRTLVMTPSRDEQAALADMDTPDEYRALA